ncbi:uncharacterized protein B0I36DRAFT_66423 [Microdochium trichocladiopsis]|uniref:Uncharacterized protein n=1 Tax=Microdochium trichocladiopsis TaxID=1682393 RepID=A0A9P9BXW4_9PEZI|nr:uncharacterized protein B0I36DRAFT_66423 [Microdochium trichocladiopsis]KAH7037453.1 hypothetical protein B0I36DRAFT_66423 [Microdochium trichocladiopsis]
MNRPSTHFWHKDTIRPDKASCYEQQSHERVLPWNGAKNTKLVSHLYWCRRVGSPLVRIRPWYVSSTSRIQEEGSVSCRPEHRVPRPWDPPVRITNRTRLPSGRGKLNLSSDPAGPPPFPCTSSLKDGLLQPRSKILAPNRWPRHGRQRKQTGDSATYPPIPSPGVLVRDGTTSNATLPRTIPCLVVQAPT